MSVRPENVEITRPCPVRLDPDRVRTGARSWYCGHCEKSVHVLSNMTEAEARWFLGQRVGEDLCVTYAVGRDGTVRFKPEPAPAPDLVPITSLRRRNARVAAGLGLALAACTPHAHPDVSPKIEVVAGPVEAQTTRTIPDRIHIAQDDVLMDGLIAPEPIPVPGRMRVEPLPPDDGVADEPCEPDVEEQPQLTRRGRWKSPPGVGG